MEQFQALQIFEISIFCVVVLAVGYWVTVWLMGRYDDVLHGDFIHAEQAAEPVYSPLPPEPFPEVRADSSESLESLLASIKRDLKDAAQI